MIAHESQKQPAGANLEPPKIVDEPKSIDPAKFVHPKLATHVTVKFTDTSLKKVAEWIQKTTKMPVFIDEHKLQDQGLALDEPITDHLDDDPIYFLLDRLESLELTWYVNDDVIHIMPLAFAELSLMSKAYNLSELLEAGYNHDGLYEAIMSGTEASWEEVNDEGGSLDWIGDILFILQTDKAHREVSALLTALKKHGRRTFTFDPPKHGVFRERLHEKVSVRLVSTPLAIAIKDLATQTGIDMRLDTQALKESGAALDETVSLTLAERELSTILELLLSPLELTWILENGVLWITPADEAERRRKSAVVDVRDLCRNVEESRKLLEVITNQISAAWSDDGSESDDLVFAKLGTLVVTSNDAVLEQIQELLKAYRHALGKSKRRDWTKIKAQKVFTHYYRINSDLADFLETKIPKLVQLQSWKSDKNPTAIGTIFKAPSKPKLIGKKEQIVSKQATLVIRQTRAAHQEILTLISNIENAYGPAFDQRYFGYGGGMGGGMFRYSRPFPTTESHSPDATQNSPKTSSP